MERGGPKGLIRPAEGREETSFLVATEIPNEKGLQRLFRGDPPLNIYSERPETSTYYRLKSKSRYFWGYLNP